MNDTKDIRKCFGWTQKQMAEITGIPLRTIQNWDYRKCMPEWLHEYIFRMECNRVGLQY